MTNPEPQKLTGLDFILLTGDILSSAARFTNADETMFDFIAEGLEEIENACLDFAHLLTEPIGTGCCLGSTVYDVVTRSINNNQQIKLYIAESKTTSEDDEDAVIRHWSEYPYEVLVSVVSILTEQLCAWRGDARRICVKNGQVITSYDKAPA